MAASLTVDELRERLEKSGLDTRGHRPQLRQRLRKHVAKVQERAREEEQALIIMEQRAAANNNNNKTSSSGSGGSKAANGKAKSWQAWQPRIDSFLVLDVEATCERGPAHRSRSSAFDFPNEIIELPVILLRWSEAEGDEPRALRVIDTFHTFVRPTWRPRLTRFARELTGIDQSTIDSAPTFPEAVELLRSFLSRHGLLNAPIGPRASPSKADHRKSGSSSTVSQSPAPALRPGVSWVTHGPYDMRDFMVKQTFISGLSDAPAFLQGPLIDVKKAVTGLLSAKAALVSMDGRVPNKPRGSAGAVWTPPPQTSASVLSASPTSNPSSPAPSHARINSTSSPSPSPAASVAPSSSSTGPFRDMTIDGLLSTLSLGPFQGKAHSGLWDTRNIARLHVELGRRVAEVAAGSVVGTVERLATARPSTTTTAAAAGGPEPAVALAALRQAEFLERAALMPNTRMTDAGRKRWHWMGARPGEVRWEEPAERHTDDEAETDKAADGRKGSVDVVDARELEKATEEAQRTLTQGRDQR